MQKNNEFFFALIKIGLWGKDTGLIYNNEIDFASFFQMAQTQSVVGLVAYGIETIKYTIPIEYKLMFVGLCSQIEQSNAARNLFLCNIFVRMQKMNITPLLLKGQSVAQCYEKPQWRTIGDIDILLYKGDYEKAVGYMASLSTNRKAERKYSKEYGFYIDDILVELHGTQRTGLSSRLDKVVDAVQDDTFRYNKIRVWHKGDSDIQSPEPNNDVFFIFVHFIKHFYKEGITLRQLCDWCRLLWTFRAEMDRPLLETRLQKAGLVQEWKSFASLSVDYLGMPIEAMPLYDGDVCWHKKGDKIVEFILNNSKHNKVKDTLALMRIFPWNTMFFLPSIFLNVNRLKIKERIFK